MVIQVHSPPLHQFVSTLVYYDGLDLPHNIDRFLPDGNTELIINLSERPQFMYDNGTLNESYSRVKAGRRPIHEKLMEEIHKFGKIEVAPKKGHVSLRHRKQFAMNGPKTNTRFEVGINAKDLRKSPRLLEQPKGSMCNYIVHVNDVKDVNSELVAWIKSAYEGAV
jgi:hypothetical protein